MKSGGVWAFMFNVVFLFCISKDDLFVSRLQMEINRNSAT